MTATAKKLPTKAAARPAKKTAKPASAPAKTAGSVGRTKADALAADLRAAGWTVNLKNGKDDLIEMAAKRGPETLRQVWRAGSWLYDQSLYTNGERSRKPRNANDARKMCTT